MKGVPLNEKLFDYIVDTFTEEDEVLKELLKESAEKEIPDIQVSPENGKFLHIMCKMINARSILEIGTLTGYSAIWMARALPESGKLTTLELEKEHADIAEKYFKKAGLEKKIKVILGKALDSLEKMKDEKFDFIFIDADKERYPDYLKYALRLINKGGIIAADNTLRFGKILDKDTDEGTRQTRLFNKMMADDMRLVSLLVPISDGVTIGYAK